MSAQIRILVWLTTFSIVGSLCAESPAPPEPRQVFQAWRGIQAKTDTLAVHVQVLCNYAAGSQIVVGDTGVNPVAPRSGRKTSKLLISGSQYWRIDHQGALFHRRFGQMVNQDLTRFYNGNLHWILERPYKEVPDWTPLPRASRESRLTLQEHGWHDLVFAPLLLHYRPFSETLNSVIDANYVVDPKSETIDGQKCWLLRRPFDAPFRVRQHQFWVTENAPFQIVRIQRVENQFVHWQYDTKFNRHGQPESYIARRFHQQDGRLAEFYKVVVTLTEVNAPIDEQQFQFQGDLKTPLQRRDQN